jgi:hypothetical protein
MDGTVMSMIPDESSSAESSSAEFPDRVCLSAMSDGEIRPYGDPAFAYIHASVQQSSDATRLYAYHFHLKDSRRFDTSFDIPAEAVNACVTLNGLLVTGLWSEHLPTDAMLPDCLAPTDKKQENHSHETSSTLAPGKTQVISFRWFEGDILRFYLYFDQ